MNPLERDFSVALFSQLSQAASPDDARAMEAYMKHNFRYLGVKSPVRKSIVKSLNPLQGSIRLDVLALALYGQPFREMHYAALDLLEAHARHAPEHRINLYHELLLRHAWWDSIDWIASKLIGGHFKRYPHLHDAWVQRWMDSGELWQQRTCLLFQLSYKKNTHTDLLRALIVELKPRKEFFIQKAIGWILRQYARTDAIWVRKLVAEEQLTGLSRREALKHIGE